MFNKFILFIIGLIPCIVCELSVYEQTYLTFPNRNNTRGYLQYYTSEPHIAGSQRDYDTAVYTLDKFKLFGLDAEIVTHEILVNYPLSREVRLLDESGTTVFAANLTEPSVVVDPTSNNTFVVSTFNGYSASGTAVSRFVYANYGRLEDFKYLQDNGVAIAGSIVIVRYGKVFRGTKAMLAQQFGATGVLLYSDPADDGYVRAGGENNTFPDGPWRPEFGVQRGSVQYWSYCPGNPSQERVAMCLGAEYENISYIGTLIPSIPVQPLSWGDAYPLLLSLSSSPFPSPPLPAEWQGGLNFTYKIGPSLSNQIYLNIQMNFTNVTIWTVVAKFAGETSEEVVLVGNHRDAWVFGAADPSSGSSAMLEIARSMSELNKATGWKPRRDILFCSWDAEEYGLMGSTAWAEENADFIQNHVVAYLNTDVGACGKEFAARGTPSLLKVVKDIANDIPYPASPDKPLSAFWQASQLSVLGSGSDYTVFLDHLGIPSLDIAYSGDYGGIYHSIYDSFYWMETFGDPGFIFHEGLAKVLGVIAIRLADEEVIPFNYTNYALQLSSYLQTIKQQVGEMSVDFSYLTSAINQFTSASISIDAQAACVRETNASVCSVDLANLNQRLQFAERRFLINSLTNSSDGLPARPWFKHVVQAPGLYDGYGAQVFPGIAQGLLDKDPIEVQQQIIRAANSILDAASALQELSVDASTTPCKCYGDHQGSINITTNGGFAPLRFSVDSTTWHPTAFFSNLTAGEYLVMATDSRNFIAVISASISQPSRLSVRVTVNSDSMAVPSVSGGAGNYSYYWSTNETTSSIKVEKGTYKLRITDANGCNVDYSFTHTPGSTKLTSGEVIVIVLSILVVVGGIIFVMFIYIRRKKARAKMYSSLELKDEEIK